MTYTVTIENTSVSSDPVTVTSFLDSGRGATRGTTPADLACEDEDGDPFLLFTTAIASGDTVTCTFTAVVSGNAGDTVGDEVTVTATDDDTGGTDATDADDGRGRA